MGFLRVGLTGGIACGKSVVRRRFESRGVATLDADEVVHGLFAPGTEVTGRVADRFGAEVLAPDGAVDRRRLGAVVFASPEKRGALEAIVHPFVFREIDAFLEARRRRGDPLAVVDAALMVETGSYARYDRVVVVFCRPEVQLRRLMARDRLSAENAERRIRAQMPVEDKKAYASHLVDSSGSLEETLERADRVLDELLAEAEAGSAS